jgi:DUF1009 family protein
VPWGLEEWDQTISRLVRNGSLAEQVFVHAIVARKTVEEVVIRIVRQKEMTENSLMRALADYTKMRRAELGMAEWKPQEKSAPRVKRRMP